MTTCCECAFTCFRRALIGAASLLKTGCVIGIIVIISLYLFKVDIERNGTDVEVSDTCLLGPDYKGHTLCEYAYAVCAISLLVSVVFVSFLYCTSHMCGVGGVLEFTYALLMAVWWAVCAIVLTQQAERADKQKVEQAGWRQSVIALCWSCTGLYIIMAILLVVDVCICVRDCLCCCWGWCPQRPRRKYEKYRDSEYGAPTPAEIDRTSEMTYVRFRDQ